jgi:hypothetical protein
MWSCDGYKDTTGQGGDHDAAYYCFTNASHDISPMFRADDPAGRLGFDCPIKVDRENVWFSPSSMLDNNSVGLCEREFQSEAENVQLLPLDYALEGCAGVLGRQNRGFLHLVRLPAGILSMVIY